MGFKSFEPVMPPIAPLNPSRHGRTRIGRFPDLSRARQQQHAILGASEIVLAAADYPVVLMKHAETGRFNVVALYGLSPERNLYVIGSHWHATYIPQGSLRFPFLAHEAGVLGLAIDEQSELIGAAAGHRLFDDAGRPTDYTVHIANTLQWLKQDFEAMQDLVRAFTQLALIKPLTLRVRMDDASESQIEGLYTVSDRALATLADSDVVALHRKGSLRVASVLVASLVQLNRLQQLHNGQSPLHIADIAIQMRE